MKLFKHTALAAVIALSTSACANLSTVYRTPNLSDGRSLVLDANQYVVLQGTPRNQTVDVQETSSSNGNGGSTTSRTTRSTSDLSVFCAQPSPDAITALAASGGLTAAYRDASAEAAAATAQMTASIGLRTQSIQLLRDHGYRLCEGYLSGALDEFTFRILQRRYQNLMTAVLAIEQLTGPVIAQQAAIGAQSSATAGASIRSLIELRIELTQKIAGDEAALEEAQNIIVPEDDAKDENQANKDRLIAQINDRLEARRNGITAIDTLMANLEPASASTNVVHALANLRQAVSLDAATIEHVSKAVENIARMVIEADYTG